MIQKVRSVTLKRKWLWCCLVILLLFPAVVTADVAYEGKSYPEDAEYIDLGDLVVRDFDGLIGLGRHLRIGRRLLISRVRIVVLRRLLHRLLCRLLNRLLYGLLNRLLLHGLRVVGIAVGRCVRICRGLLHRLCRRRLLLRLLR